MAIVLAFYAIWYVRNHVCLIGILLAWSQVMVTIWRAIHELYGLDIEHMHISVSDLKILKYLGVKGVLSKAHKIVSVIWFSPQSSRIKV